MKQLVYLTAAVALLGCAGEGDDAAQTQAKVIEAAQPVQQKEEAAMIIVTGTVVFKELEGGFYGLDSDDGKKYMPHGMDKSLLKNGMKVRVKGHIMTDMMSFQQYGEMLKVVESEMIDDSDVRELNEY